MSCNRLSCLLLALLAPMAMAAPTAVEREQVGERVSEAIPPLPAPLTASLQRYAQARGASLIGWLGERSLLISTRFGNTQQVHRVDQPLGMRRQLTFYAEPVTFALPQPGSSDRFVYLRDDGGSEFWQLYLRDLADGSTRRLSAGGNSRNQAPLFSRDGRLLAFTSTARNGRDGDLWLHDLRSGSQRPLLTAGGAWSALDFSPDGRHLLALQFISINETYPALIELASGELKWLPLAGERAAVTAMRFAPDGSGLFRVSDENSEFRRLRFEDFVSRRERLLSGELNWDVAGFTLSRDGRRLAYVVNQEGYGRLRVLDWPSGRALKIPEPPRGVIGALEFSPSGRRLALQLTRPTAPSDVYVLELAGRSWQRWTDSELGELRAEQLIEPELIHFPSFDQVDGAPRQIPAYYYRPRGQGRFPVVIHFHGGPEVQALPVFSPTFQYYANELGIAVLVPNVRGSAGYGKHYLQLDNGRRRKDAVADAGALLDWIAKRPELDSERVGVMGGSYGGYMVLASMVEFADRIAAGINVVGISSFVTFLASTQQYRQDLRRAEYGDERDPAMRAFFEQISPLYHAHRIASPLFVAQGRNDPRVPVSEANQIVAAVRAQGRPVWYLEFADEGHGFAKKANRDFFDAAAVLFWRQHLLGEAALSRPEPAAAPLVEAAETATGRDSDRPAEKRTAPSDR